MVFLSFAVQGQERAEIKFNHLNKSNGFPVDFVYDMEFDSAGCMWATTSEGLMRYNGHSAKLYRSGQGEKNVLPFFLYHLYIDKNEKIWLNYFDAAISCFDPATEKFTHFIYNPEDPNSFPEAQASEFFEDSKGNFWIGTWGGGLLKYNPEHQNFLRIPVETGGPDSLQSPVITCFAEERDGSILLGSWEGENYNNYIFRFDPVAFRFSRFSTSEYYFENEIERKKIEQEAFKIVHFIEIDDHNNLWVGTYSGLFYVDRTAMTVVRVTGLDKSMLYWVGHVTFDNTLSCLYDGENNIWISTEVGGVMIVDMETHRTSYLNKEIENGNSVSGNQIRDMAKDAYGNIWIATEGGGVDVYSAFEQQFKIISNDRLNAIRQNKAQGLYAVNNFLISSDQKEIVVGHGNGASIYSIETGRTQHISLQRPFKDFMVQNPAYQKYNFNNPNYVTAVSEFPGHYVLGTYIGWVIYDRLTGDLDFKEIDKNGNLNIQSSTQEDFFMAIRRYSKHPDKPTDTLLADVVKYYPESGVLEPEFEIPYWFENLGVYSARYLIGIDSDNFLIDYNDKAFIVYNLRDKKQQYYSKLSPFSNAPDTNMVLLHADTHGICWFDSPSGIYMFDYRTGDFENISPFLNLKENDKVRALNRDKSGIAWIALTYDLLRYDPVTHEVFRFTSKHGLDVGAFVRMRIEKSDWDKLVFPVNYGLLVFDSEKVSFNTERPHMLLTDMILVKDTLNPARLQELLSNETVLDWDQNFITFEFASDMLYTVGGKSYEYRLVGLDSAWTQAGDQNKVTYTNLEPGPYVFEARCRDSFDVLSETLHVRFTIDHPYWLKWWFILSEVMLVIAGIFVFVKVRERNLKRSKLVLEKTVAHRTAQVQEKVQEIKRQKDIIESKNKELTDSIHYAKRIQHTLLASEEQLGKYLPEFFILYKPKDIVSGDFYWAVNANESFYLAICDSTGHGVPGAFMSLLNIRFLYEAVVEKKLASPEKALDFVRKRLVESVSKDGGKDGMDGTLIRFDRETGTITYASAQNRPVMIRDGEIMNLSADKMPVGLGEKNEPFHSFTIETRPGDRLYFFTDGLQDQFGGSAHAKPGGKKLKRKRLLELLSKNYRQSMKEQHDQLNTFVEEWRGDLEQVDDILMIGLKM